MAELGNDLPAVERNQLFVAGWQRIERPLTHLWVQYLALGGHLDLFSVDAFMHGLLSVTSDEQDILAQAINEELNDRYLAAKVPYLHTLDCPTEGRDLLTVLDELYGSGRPDEPDNPGA